MSKHVRVLCCGVLLLLSIVSAPAGRAAASGGTIDAGTYGYSCVGFTNSAALFSTSIDMPANPSYLEFFLKCAFRPFDAVDSEVLSYIAASTSSTVHSGTAGGAGYTPTDGGGGTMISNNVASGNNVGNSGCNPSTKASNGLWTMHHGRIVSHSGSTIEAAETAAMPDNVVYFRIRCSDNAGFGDQNNFRFTPPWMGQFPPYVAQNSTTHNNDCGMDYHVAGSSNSGGIPVCWGTSESATWGDHVTGVWPDHWAGQEPSLPLPSCQEIGVSFETRESGVGSDWVDVVDGEFPAMSFGDSIRWTMELPDSSAYEDPVQVDHLAFFQLNDTPIRVTGDAPNYRNYHLEGFSRELIDPVNGSWPTDLTEQVASGVGVTWAIKPGDGLSQEVGPFTHTGTFLYLGKSGDAFELLVDCHVYGAGFPIESMRTDGSTYGPGSVNSRSGCLEVSVVHSPIDSTDTQWSFRVQKAASTTNAEELWWRYESTDPFTPDDWVEVTPVGWPTSSAVGGDVLIAKADAPNPLLVRWKCVEAIAGGGTRDVESATKPPGNGVGVEGQESCYGAALASMELTRPVTWVSGAGRMGVCLIEFLFVPDGADVAESFDGFTAELEAQLPFSLLYSVITFGANFYDGATESAETGCLDMGGEWSFGAYGDVSVPDVCIGEDLTVTSGQRQTLVYLMLGGLWFAVARHAFALIRGSALGGAFNP